MKILISLMLVSASALGYDERDPYDYGMGYDREAPKAYMAIDPGRYAPPRPQDYGNTDVPVRTFSYQGETVRCFYTGYMTNCR